MLLMFMRYTPTDERRLWYIEFTRYSHFPLFPSDFQFGFDWGIPVKEQAQFLHNFIQCIQPFRESLVELFVSGGCFTVGVFFQFCV